MDNAGLFDERWVTATGESRIVGMERDPSTLFVYWHVDENRQAVIAKHFHSTWGQIPQYLCVYDVTDVWFDGYNAPLVARILVQPENDRWYVHNLHPNRNYIVDLATTTIHERLFSILRTNVVTLPASKTVSSRPLVQFRAVDRKIGFLDGHPCESELDGCHIHEQKVDSLCLKGI